MAFISKFVLGTLYIGLCASVCDKQRHPKKIRILDILHYGQGKNKLNARRHLSLRGVSRTVGAAVLPAGIVT